MFSLAGILLLVIAALCFAAVPDGKIKGSLRQNGRAFNPGDEKALAEIATPEQLARWQQQGLIEGTWGDAASFPDTNQATTEELEPIVTKISAGFYMNREAGETPLQFLQRLAENASEVGDEMEARLKDVQQREESISSEGGEAQTRISELEEHLAAAKSAPAATSLAPLKSLDAPVIGKLVKADFDTIEKINAATDEQLVAIDGIAEGTVTKIRELLK